MQSKSPPFLPALWRLLTFKITREEVLQFGNRELIFGLLCVWLVGMGRSWDDPKAEIFQRLGVGSVLYVFALTLILWLVARPLAMEKVTYGQIFIFVCLVSPPGITYAIPVEKFLDAAAARSANQIFLAIVATWRVALLFFYLSRIVQLRRSDAVIAALTLLAVIAAPLTVLHVLADILIHMGGIREGGEIQDPVKDLFLLLGLISIVAFLPLLITHGVLSSRRGAEREAMKQKMPTAKLES